MLVRPDIDIRAGMAGTCHAAHCDDEYAVNAGYRANGGFDGVHKFQGEHGTSSFDQFGPLLPGLE